MDPTDTGAPTVIHIATGLIKARKAHVCDDCFTPIHPGNSYFRSVWKVDGEMRTIHLHPGCKTV